ncbi:MAG: histone deacetylase [Gemmatimonadales bacterium]|nr:MAG: histone deacetylase [Gemmatimonadales bacterium]
MSPSAPTGFLLHPSASLHDTGWEHPEHQGRLRFLASTVGKDMLALFGRAEQVPAGEGTVEDLLRVHTRDHVDRVRQAVAQAQESGSLVALDPDTTVSSASWEAAMGSLGAALTAVDAVSRGSLRNAFVATRPPGHHATRERAMGFCLFNTVAATARWLQAHRRADRVLVVDWDVHHGNGTQDIFWTDPTVFYLSLHQHAHYPGTGAASEIGGGPGEGTTLNVPLAAGTSRSAYREAFVAALDRALEGFSPDFVLISAGFDALAGDPLGGLLLEPEDFHALTREVMIRTEESGKRLVAFLEGGYDPRRTGLAAVAVIRALADISEADPTAPVPSV